MVWQLEWAGKEAVLTQIAKTGKTPAALERKPEVTRWLIPYIEAFDALSSCRPIGMAVGHITLSEMKAWCDMTGETDYSFFIKVIQQADRAFIESINKKNKSKVKSSKPRKKHG